MNEKEFSISALLKEGWELAKVNSGFLIVYQIILWALVFLFIGLSGSERMAPFLVLLFVLAVLVKMGLFQSVLLMTKGIKPQFDQLYCNWPQFFSWLAASIFFGVLFDIGLILFVIPGCYVLARYGLYPFFILDQKLGPVEAIQKAAEASRGVRWHLFLLILTCTLINVIGFCIFFFGCFITVPITLLALATAYRSLTGQSKESIQPEDL